MPSSNAAKLWWKRSSDRLTVASARAATVDRNASQSGVAGTPRCRPWRIKIRHFRRRNDLGYRSSRYSATRPLTTPRPV